MKYLAVAAVLLACLITPIHQATAQSTGGQSSTWKLRKQANAGVVRIVSGGMHSTSFQMASELSSLVDGTEGLRLLSLMGEGSLQNVADMLYLKGVDLAIVQTDVLDYMKKQRVHGGIERRVRYIAKLFNEEVHILARAPFKSLKQLAGRKVSIGPQTDGSYVTSSLLLNSLNIPIKPIFQEPDTALEMLKAGQIDAMIYVEGKPLNLFKRIRPADKLRFIPVPLSDAVQNTYLPSTLTSEDYPNLIPKGKSVSTLAVGNALMAFNWKTDTSRYQNVAKFIDAFFKKFPKLQEKPYHSKWSEVNLAAHIPGWNRVQAVDAVLASTAIGSGHDCPEPALRVAFQRFFTEVNVVPAAGTITPQQAENLFQDFQRWLKKNPQ